MEGRRKLNNFTYGGKDKEKMEIILPTIKAERRREGESEGGADGDSE